MFLKIVIFASWIFQMAVTLPNIADFTTQPTLEETNVGNNGMMSVKLGCSAPSCSQSGPHWYVFGTQSNLKSESVQEFENEMQLAEIVMD